MDQEVFSVSLSDYSQAGVHTRGLASIPTGLRWDGIYDGHFEVGLVAALPGYLLIYQGFPLP